MKLILITISLCCCLSIGFFPIVSSVFIGGTKPGDCPVEDRDALNEVCKRPRKLRRCRQDKDCSGTKKCCLSRCYNKICTKPVVQSPNITHDYDTQHAHFILGQGVSEPPTCVFSTQELTLRYKLGIGEGLNTCEDYCKWEAGRNPNKGYQGGYCKKTTSLSPDAEDNCYCSRRQNLVDSDVKLCTEVDGGGTCVNVGLKMNVPRDCIDLGSATDPSLQAMNKNIKSIIYANALCITVYPYPNCNRNREHVPHGRPHRHYIDLPVQHDRARNIMEDLLMGSLGRQNWGDGIQSLNRKVADCYE